MEEKSRDDAGGLTCSAAPERRVIKWRIRVKRVPCMSLNLEVRID
jgi:hypothetical protein